MMKRRDALLSGLFGTVGLRALATGLPAWFIANPRKANAQSLQCAITAQQNMQYLVVNTSSMGDPINCNCPGTYQNSDIIHPTQAEMAAGNVALGSQTFQAALPWRSTADGGKLAPATLTRLSFFHHLTGSTVHGDQPKVMKLLGKTSGNEMLVSAFAKHLGPCFGTVQNEPIAVGAGGNASELVSFSGRTLPAIAPTQLKQLLTGSKTDPLVKLRSLRDTALDQLNALAKTDSTQAQSAFLDAFALSQTQVRELADMLSTTLTAITADDVKGQTLAAAALIAANVTPVVTLHIPFGGDNHSDQNLQAEADQHADNNNNNSGVKGIQTLMDSLSSLSLSDKVTFATLNVFGRNLNGITKVTNRTGRDHYGNHSVMLMIGKNISPGVIGGVVAGTSGAYAASPIDSSTGLASASGDIAAADTHAAAARTLGVALGIPSGIVSTDFITTAGGKVVNAALNGVSG
jgi:hypothetical protein